MIEADVYHALLMLMFALAGAAFVGTGLVVAPYGRHERGGFGPSLPERLGWLLMESPAALVFVFVFTRGPRSGDLVPLFFLSLWLGHYLYRAFIYPLRMRSRPGRRMPLLVVALAVVFNSLNAYLNARWITALGPEYTWRWLLTFRFAYGLLVFVAGLAINRWADGVLRKLRRPGEEGYQIPRGGLYDEISCPNYFGELLQWLGWAIATWSAAGLAFAAFTAANLVPRAVSHHRWYRRQFPDYPRRRKAIFPHLL